MAEVIEESDAATVGQIEAILGIRAWRAGQLHQQRQRGRCESKRGRESARERERKKGRESYHETRILGK